MPTPRRSLTGWALLALLAPALTGCGGLTASASAREADQHAEVAATVMTRSAYPIPANDAAWTVVGSTDTTTIDAMGVSGTAWDGAVTLRITVDHEATGWGSDDRSVRCYRYRFDHRYTETAYSRVDCPPGPPLTLTGPLHPDLSSRGAAHLAAALTALAPSGRTEAGIRQVLTALYPPPVGSGVSAGVTTGTFDVGVSYTGSCMTGSVPAAGPATVMSQPRITCQGG